MADALASSLLLLKLLQEAGSRRAARRSDLVAEAHLEMEFHLWRHERGLEPTLEQRACFEEWEEMLAVSCGMEVL